MYRSPSLVKYLICVWSADRTYLNSRINSYDPALIAAQSHLLLDSKQLKDMFEYVMKYCRPFIQRNCYEVFIHL
jgi:hypothetical protein